MGELFAKLKVGEVDTEPLLASGHELQLAVLATPMFLLHNDPAERMGVAGLLQFLRDHAAISGLSAAQLDEPHDDCRRAVHKLVQTWSHKVGSALRQREGAEERPSEAEEEGEEEASVDGGNGGGDV